MRKTELEKRPDMIDQVYILAKEGLPIKTIAPMLGVSRDTMFNYFRHGRDSESINEDERTDKQQLYLNFFSSFELGQAEFVREMMKTIREKGESRTLLTLLERLRPKEFGVVTRFDEEDIERYLRGTFAEETVEGIYKLMREDINARIYG